MPASRPLDLDRVEQIACYPLQGTQASGIKVVRSEPALSFVVRVVTTVFIKLQPYTRSGHPEGHKLEKRWHWISGLHQSFIEPLTLPRKSPFYLLLFLLGHWLKSREATTFHSIETQAVTDEIKVPHDLVAAVNALGDDAGEGLPEEPRAMEDEAESVEEDLHNGGHLERVVRGCKDDPIRRHDLLDKHVPVVLQGTEFLTLVEAQLATSAGPKLIVAQGDYLVLDITKRLQVFQELADRVICALFAGASNEGSDPLHVLTSIIRGAYRVQRR